MKRPDHSAAGTRELLVLLLCGDLLCIVLHLLHYTTTLAPSRLFALQLDGGYAEFYQYLKELWLVVLSLLLFQRRRQSVYVVSALLALYLLLDDALKLHETLGMKLVFHQVVQTWLGLRAQDWGELLVMFCFGSLFLLAFLASYRTDAANSRKFMRNLLPWFALLIFFGSVLDMVDSMAPFYGMFLLEDGGEMVAMSLLVWQVWGHIGEV